MPCCAFIGLGYEFVVLPDQQSVILIVMAPSGHGAPGNRPDPSRYRVNGSDGDARRIAVSGRRSSARFILSIPGGHYYDEKDVRHAVLSRRLPGWATGSSWPAAATAPVTALACLEWIIGKPEHMRNFHHA